MVNRRNTSSYAHWSDEEIAMAAKSGAKDAEIHLLERFGSLVRRTARAYFLMGGEMCDLEQEGYIGLLKAARTYSPDRKLSFRSFAKMCITRQMISAVKMANRKKHSPLNSYVSLSEPNGDEEGPTVEETVADERMMSPEENFLQEEAYRAASLRAKTMLSPLEIAVLDGHLSGKSYEEVAASLGKDVKAVDNALQRIRKKLKGMLKA